LEPVADGFDFARVEVLGLGYADEEFDELAADQTTSSAVIRGHEDKKEVEVGRPKLVVQELALGAKVGHIQPSDIGDIVCGAKYIQVHVFDD